MKKLQACAVENCIPTPSSCVTWNGGDIAYLGICNGDSLNNIVWEIVNKLEEIAGQDLSDFDIDSLTDICNQKAPQETTLISILSLLKNNQVCIKDYIDGLNDRLNELSAENDVNVNLKCFADFDNLGNSLSITRDELDQLVINNLCSQKDRIATTEGRITAIQSQLDNLEINPVVQEPTFPTCIDSAVKPTSEHTKSLSTALCALRDATGTPAEITTALGQTYPDFDQDFQTVDPANWITSANRNSWADHYNNLLIAFGNLVSRVKFMEENCCAISCKDIEIGFTARLTDDGNNIEIRFTAGAGTNIPAGVTDKGSKGTITDSNKHVETFNLTITNNGTVLVPVGSLDLDGDLDIDITAILGTPGLTCEKCVHRMIRIQGAKCCSITNTATDNVTIIYETE